MRLRVSVPPHFRILCHGCGKLVDTNQEPLYADSKGGYCKACHEQINKITTVKSKKA